MNDINKLPVVAYFHRDGDEQDQELVDLMIAFEKNIRDIDVILKIAAKRIRMGNEKLAKMWLEYAYPIADKNTRKIIKKQKKAISTKL